MADYRDQRSSSEIEQDLETTRRDMHDTVDALEDKFSAGQLLDEVWTRIRGDRTFRAMGSDAGAIVREHPIPLALVGVGLAWLAIEKAASSAAHAGHAGADAEGPSPVDKVMDNLSGAAGPAKEWTGEVNDTGQDLAGRAKEGAHQVGDQLRRRGTQVTQGVRSAMQEQPLVVGAIAFGLGLASGLAVPSSSWEDKTMGVAADALKGQVKDRTGNLSETARQFAEQAKQSVKHWPEASSGLQESTEQAGGRPTEKPADLRF